MKNLIKILIVYFCVNGWAANIYEQSTTLKPPCYPSIKLEGEIKNGDAKKIESLITKINQTCGDRSHQTMPRVVFESKGGDVDEAMSIGRVIRKYGYSTQLMFVRLKEDQSYGCFSSCVLAFASGVHKDSENGVLGIHRPFFSTTISKDLTLDQIRMKREKLNETIRTYLNEMDVSTKLLDDMLSIPPEKIKILTKEEKSLYRLEGYDANYDEFTNARSARVYGMTPSEFRAKDAQVTKICHENSEKIFGICYLTRLLGISKEEAQARIDWNTACRKNSDDIEGCATTAFRRKIN